MALETLKGIKEIGGFELKQNTWKQNNFLEVCHDQNALTFKIQNGPIKENGVNGCQVETIIAAAKMIIDGLNQKLPCRENAMAITKLDEALLWLMKRKIDREGRNVEGFNKE